MTTWRPAAPSQVVAQVPVKVPGGPVVKVSRHVWHGRIVREVDGVRAPQWDACPHNHKGKRAALVCAEQAARRVNRIGRTRHEPWPQETTIRSKYGPVKAALEEAGKVSPRAFPLTGWCQPCGRPIVRQEPGEDWQHQDEEED